MNIFISCPGCGLNIDGGVKCKKNQKCNVVYCSIKCSANTHKCDENDLSHINSISKIEHLIESKSYLLARSISERNQYFVIQYSINDIRIISLLQAKKLFIGEFKTLYKIASLKLEELSPTERLILFDVNGSNVFAKVEI